MPKVVHNDSTSAMGWKLYLINSSSATHDIVHEHTRSFTVFIFNLILIPFCRVYPCLVYTLLMFIPFYSLLLCNSFIFLLPFSSLLHCPTFFLTSRFSSFLFFQTLSSSHFQVYIFFLSSFLFFRCFMGVPSHIFIHSIHVRLDSVRCGGVLD